MLHSIIISNPYFLNNDWDFFFICSNSGPFIFFNTATPSSLYKLMSFLLYFSLILFKGHLRYKTITSQNVLPDAQVKNFFVLQRNYVPFTGYLSFSIFNHPMIYQICNVMVSISTWDRCIFEYIFWTTTH